MKNCIACFFLWCCSSSAFSQNTLNDFLESALRNSPIHNDTKTQENSLTIDSMLVHARLNPQIGFTSSVYAAPTIAGYGYDAVLTNNASANALFGVNYTFTGSGEINNQLGIITSQKESSVLSSKLSERDLKQGVTSQYITVYGEQQILSTIEKVLDILKNEEQILKKGTESGIYKQTDYLTFRVSYSQQQLTASQLKAQIVNDVFILNYLCGINDTSVVVLTDPQLNILQPKSIEQSSPYRQFAIDSLQLQQSILQLNYQYKPKVTVFGDAGYLSTFQFQSEKNFGLSVGLNLSIPLYDGNQKKLQLEKLQLGEVSRQNHIDYYKKQYTIKQVQLLQQIGQAELLILQAQEQYSLSKTLLAANNLLLETGDAKIADYIIALTTYVSSQTATQQFNMAKMQLVNQYNYLNY